MATLDSGAHGLTSPARPRLAAPKLPLEGGNQAADIAGLEDEELMGLVKDGDARAFELLYDRHGAVAFRLAVGICTPSERAADVTQEAFLALWRGRSKFNPARGALRPWILMLVRHKAIDSQRRTRTADSLRVDDDGLAELVESCERTDVEAARRAEARIVRDALDTLPVDQRRVIELAFFAGFTHSEIARSLGVPTGTVKGRMRLGFDKLRSHLELADLRSCA